MNFLDSLCLVSLDVVSLFTRVPVAETIALLTLFPSAMVELFLYILGSTYFLYNGEYYEQVEDVPDADTSIAHSGGIVQEAFETRTLQLEP